LDSHITKKLHYAFIFSQRCNSVKQIHKEIKSKFLCSLSFQRVFNRINKKFSIEYPITKCIETRINERFSGSRGKWSI